MYYICKLSEIPFVAGPSLSQILLTKIKEDLKTLALHSSATLLAQIPKSFTLIPKSVSEASHCEGILFAPSVRSDSHAMTNLFSMYEVRIICLWTWHQRRVNSCEATQAFGPERRRFILLILIPPSLIWFQHWEMPLIRKSSVMIFPLCFFSPAALRAPNVLPSVSLRRFCSLASGTGVTSPSRPNLLTRAVLYFSLSCHSSCP